MFKNLIFILLLILFSCKPIKDYSKGNFNDIIILTSKEDKFFLEPIINNYYNSSY